MRGFRFSISKNLIDHSLNLGIRGITIVLRFLLIFGLGRYYSTEDLGVFGLLSTTITIVIFFLGFDFYAYAHREILAAGKKEQVKHIGSSLALFAITYIIVLPICLFIFFANILPIHLLVWFYVLAILEHISQELYRLFILFSQQLFANVLLFLRMAAWILPVLFYWLFNDFVDLQLEIIFSAWCVGLLVSVGLGIYRLKQHYASVSIDWQVDWQWIRRGIFVSAQFLVGTLAYKVIEFSDRYFLDYYLDKKSVGIYTFYYNFANTLQTLVFTLVIANLYPKLAEYYVTGKKDLFESYKQQFQKQVILISLIGSILVFFIIFPILYFVAKPEFYDSITTYAVLIVAVTLLNISFVPHYVLYAKGRDKAIMVTTLVCAGINIVFNLMLTQKYGLLGSASSTVLSYSFLLISKYIYAASSEK